MNTSDDIDVRAIRLSLGMTQEAFANRFGFKLRTLRSWEQRYKRPSAAVQTLLKVISCSPELVDETLKATITPSHYIISSK